MTDPDVKARLVLQPSCKNKGRTEEEHREDADPDDQRQATHRAAIMTKVTIFASPRRVT
jgi:hypothetical protein